MYDISDYDLLIRSVNEPNSAVDDNSSVNNMKGLILNSGNTALNLYIATIIDGVVYYLTMMPNIVSNVNDAGDIGLSLLPIKVTDNMKISDLVDENIFGKMYNVQGSMSQNFAVKSSSTNNSIFTMGYASNLTLSKLGSFSVRSKIVEAVQKVGNSAIQIPISYFASSSPTTEGQFVMTDSFNLPPGSLYAGVNYRFSYSGDTFYIPYYPLKPNGKLNTLIFFPDNFVASSGFVSNVTSSTLFAKSNCSVVYEVDARDVLASNMLGKLNETIFTNTGDCIVGVNYNYCPTTVTCSGNCYSRCPINGNCVRNNSSTSFECVVPLTPIDPEFAAILADITPVNESILISVLVVSLFVIIFVIIAAILFYSSRKSKTTTE